MVWVLGIVMVVLLFLGFPMMLSLIIGPIIAINIFHPDLEMLPLIQQSITYVRDMTLIAVPMFIFAANIVTKGETADRLLDIVSDFVGHYRGGLAITTSAACTLFGAISGSTQAAVVAMGGPMYPKMLKGGYGSSFSLALIINSSDIALLIPPSIAMIIYGVITGTSVGTLFIAGIGPGILIFLMFSIYNIIYARRYNIPKNKRSNWKSKFKSLRRGIWGLGFPIIIVGGIYGGIFSPNEAAGASILYGIILEGFIYKSISLNDIPDIALDTSIITAVVFILIAMGGAFSWIVTFARIPGEVLPIILGQDPTFMRTVIVIVVAYFIGCMFVDPIVVIMILTPILHPVGIAAGIDPILLGVLITLQAAIGSATPPFGVDIFTAMAVFRRPYLETVKKAPPFILILILATILLIVFPQISLFLAYLGG